VFTVTGTRTLEYAQAFQAYLEQALTAGTLNIVQGDTVAGTGHVTYAAPVSGDVNEAVLQNASGVVDASGLSATVPAGYQFLFDALSGSSTITGSAAGSDVLVTGINAAATFLDEGGENSLVFVNGNNTYIGDTTASAGSDHIVTGSGFDTVYTGTGQATVDSGTGRATIVLQDSTAGAATAFNDYVYLDDGHSTVYANGMRDAIVATAPGQTIDGGIGTGQNDVIVLVASTSDGNDVINGGAATVALFDNSSGNSVFGGSGALSFIGGADVSASVVGGSGGATIFGASGDSITYFSNVAATTAVIVAGFGNETLNGSGAQNSLMIYGATSDEASITSAINDSLSGGTGNDTLVSGAGYETLSGGGGDNLFVIDATNDGVGAHITIADFGATSGNLVGFANYTTAQVQAALDSATTVSGGGGEVNTVITLSDNTQVTFIGVSSLSGHTIL
jgi:Ca2+-binding RTX toxin-like protein